MSNIEKEKTIYLREIKSLMLCKNKLTKQFIADMSESIDGFIADNNVSDFAEVIGHFGSAEDISRSFLAKTDLAYIVKRMKIKRIILTCLLIALALWGAVVGFAAIDTYKENRGYGVESGVIDSSESLYENYTTGENVT